MKPLTLLFSLLGSMLVLAGTVPRAAEKDLGFLLSGHPHIPRDTGALGVKLNSPRHIPRDTSFHQSHPAILAQSPAAHGLSPPASQVSAIRDLYSSNWAGLVYEAPAPGQRFTFVGGYLVIPEYKLPPNAGDALYVTAPWVGIEGWGLPHLFQAGLSINMRKQGDSIVTDAHAWMEWYPDNSYRIPEFNFAPGDTVEIRIFSDWNAATHGSITFVNHNTGQRVDKDLDGSPGLAISGRTVEWIVEKVPWDPQGNPLTDFGAIHWTNCYAESKPIGGGEIQRYDLLGATKLHIREGTTIWTDVAISGPNDFWLAWKPRHT